MSTRCQIGFYEKDSDKIRDGQVFVYRHSDGYPESVLKDLKPFLDSFNKYRGLNDTTYATARCVQFLANIHDELIKKLHKDHNIKNMNDSLYLGFGIDTEIHGDIEYFYHVSPTKVQVFQPVDGDWKLLKTVVIKQPKKIDDAITQAEAVL